MSQFLARARSQIALSAFAIWKRDHEPELKLLPSLCSRPGVAVDVGAHRGLYTYYLARLCTVVYAFEPIPALARRLRLATGPRVHVEEVALSQHRAKQQIRWPEGNFSWSTIEAANRLELAEGSILSAEVESRPLDEYRLAGVTFVKIDVEGHECEVIAGATGTLRDCRPNLIVEVEDRHRPGAVAAVAAQLGALDYDGCFLDGGRLRPLAEFSSERDQPRANVSRAGKLGRYINNFVFTPRERPRPQLAVG
jgi:FkbM family methyltransferase